MSYALQVGTDIEWVAYQMIGVSLDAIRWSLKVPLDGEPLVTMPESMGMEGGDDVMDGMGGEEGGGGGRGEESGLDGETVNSESPTMGGARLSASTLPRWRSRSSEPSEYSESPTCTSDGGSGAPVIESYFGGTSISIISNQSYLVVLLRSKDEHLPMCYPHDDPCILDTQCFSR